MGAEGRASRVGGSGPSFTAFQIKVWTANPQQFVEDEDDDTFSYTVRIAAQDLLLVRAPPASAPVTAPAPSSSCTPDQAQRGRRRLCPRHLGVTGERLERSPRLGSQSHALGSGSQVNIRARVVPRTGARCTGWRHQDCSCRTKQSLASLRQTQGCWGQRPGPCSRAPRLWQGLGWALGCSSVGWESESRHWRMLLAP